MTTAQIKKYALSGLVAVIAVAIANRVPQVSKIVNNR